MNTVSAHELAKTVDCKAPGCTETATATRGRYAGLCERHSKEKQASTGGGKPVAKGEREQAVRDVLAIAKQLDKQTRSIEKLRAKAQGALDAVKAAQVDHARLEAGYLTACRAAGLQSDPDA